MIPDNCITWFKRLFIGALGMLVLWGGTAESIANAQSNSSDDIIHLPLVSAFNTDSAAPSLESRWLTQINYHRVKAGVGPISAVSELNANCYEHARYMAENNNLTHHQDPSDPYASPNGQLCAERGNAWLGGEYHQPIWIPGHSIDGWMESVGHRLWLLYPTSRHFGFGFYTSDDDNRAGAALDVLSRAHFELDEAYPDWPVRYPGVDEYEVPATRYPITLNWRYFGGTPQLTMTNLTTADGRAIAHDANTNLPAGHKGIQIIPTQPLPDNTAFTVTVQGVYEGQPFTYSWQFSTADAESAPAYP